MSQKYCFFFYLRTFRNKKKSVFLENVLRIVDHVYMILIARKKWKRHFRINGTICEINIFLRLSKQYYSEEKKSVLFLNFEDDLFSGVPIQEPQGSSLPVEKHRSGTLF